MSLIALEIYGQGPTGPITNTMKNLTYKKCGHLWSYLGKIVSITRHFLNAAARNPLITAFVGIRFSDTAKSLAMRLKVLAIVSVPFNLGDLNSTVEKIWTSLSHNDREGAVLASLSFTIMAADVVDSVTTFINASRILNLMPPVDAFVAMGLPLGYTMAGLGTVSRTIQIIKSKKLSRHIDQEIMSRSADKPDLLIEELKITQKQLVKKREVDAIAIAANIISLSASTLFAMGSVSSVPFALLGVSFSVRLGGLYHQDH